MKFIIKYFAKYKTPYFLALLFLTVEAVCDLIQPSIMSMIVDNGLENKNLTYIINASLLMLLVTAIGAVGAMVRNYLASTVSQKFSCDLRLDVFTKVQKLSFDSIDKIEQGSLITRLTNDITQIQNFSYGNMRIFVKAPITCIGAMIMMFILDYQLAIILSAILPISILLIYISMKIGLPFFLKVQVALDKLNTKMREYLSGVRVVKAFNRYNFEEEKFALANNELADTTIKTMRVMAFFTPGIALTVNIGIVFILYLGGFRVMKDGLAVGKIMAFVLYMTQILHSLSLMANIFNMFVRANASSKRISEIMDAEEAPNNTKDFNNNIHDNEVIFRHVEFSYINSKTPVLINISFSCKKGETIGIIGSTGSGKTTLLNLILRFYDVTKGEILINGINVKEYNLKELRDFVSIVPQKNILFTGTVLDNLKYGNETASLEEIQQATKIACADEFIDKIGYDRMLGHGGVNLSGGQKQRLCIARSLVKKPKILILDDCTSAVDIATEQKIKKRLKEYTEDLVCFIVSQRISSVMDCNKVIVIENGEIVGTGEHGELIKNCDVYRDIYRSQIGNLGDVDDK